MYFRTFVFMALLNIFIELFCLNGVIIHNENQYDAKTTEVFLKKRDHK